MYDVNFFKESFKIKKKIVSKEFSEADYNLIENELENIRAKSPHIFNIETTNYCNMTPPDGNVQGRHAKCCFFCI